MWRSPAFAIAVAAPSPQPDGVQRGLVGEVIKRFEARGYSLRGLKLMNVERSLAESHYADLSSKPFFGALVDYICSGPVVAMVRRAVLEGHFLSSLCGPALVLILSRPCFYRVVSPLPWWLAAVSHQVWEGRGIVATGRKMIGATNPQASEPGTIRGDYAIEVGRNVIHGSDSVENAQKEIALWFGGACWCFDGGEERRWCCIICRLGCLRYAQHACYSGQ